MGKKIGQKVSKSAKKSQNTFNLISTVKKLLDWSKNVTVRTYYKLSRDKNGPKRNGQKVLKNAKKSQNTFHLISTVRKLLDQSKNITVRTYHNLSRDKMGQKNWSKSAKKCQKEPKYVSPYKYS